MGSLTTFPKNRFVDGKHVPLDEENVIDQEETKPEPKLIEHTD